MVTVKLLTGDLYEDEEAVGWQWLAPFPSDMVRLVDKADNKLAEFPRANVLYITHGVVDEE